MTRDELRIEYERLSWLRTLDDSSDLLDRCMSYLYKVIENHHRQAGSTANLEAEIVNQMIFTKTAHLKKLLKGTSYVSDSGTSLNNIIDPTIVASHVRNLYETVAMFNLVYVNTTTSDEKTLEASDKHSLEMFNIVADLMQVPEGHLESKWANVYLLYMSECREVEIQHMTTPMRPYAMFML